MSDSTIDLTALKQSIRRWAGELGFQQARVCGADLGSAEQRYRQWLEKGYAGDMEYLWRHGSKRTRPAELVPGTRSIVSVRMDYLPADDDPWKVLRDPQLAYISRYALGRDYHKMMRNRLQQLARRIQESAGPFGYRAFVDSAPVLERPIAQLAGIGWNGKHTLTVSRSAGCWFFLGELYTDLPLPPDEPERDHCGRCQACLEICPTGAIVAPYELDARRCISYLTIEFKGSIPEPLRPLMGNRIYGCDDCLLVCPWNRFATTTRESDFQPRNGLDSRRLVELLRWSEDEFLKRLEGSPIRRIGHPQWLRNIAVALGNGSPGPEVILALQERLSYPSGLVREHVQWALAQLTGSERRAEGESGSP